MVKPSVISNQTMCLFTNELKLHSSGCRLYSKDDARRYYYYKNISEVNNGKKATVIMINPSEQHINEELPDNTINNLYEILKETKNVPFSSFEIVNLYSTRNSKPRVVIKEQVEELNRKILKEVIEKAEIVIPAWSTEEKFNDCTDVKALLKEIKEWCKNKVVLVVTNKYPCHFSVQCTSINRNPEFVEYKF